jgi:hypothetical protein
MSARAGCSAFTRNSPRAPSEMGYVIARTAARAPPTAKPVRTGFEKCKGYFSSEELFWSSRPTVFS